MIVLEPVGYVHNACKESQAPESIKKEVSEISILPEYAEGLLGIEQSEYLDLVFAFHREKRTELITRVRTGETKGIFASRSPKRPNHLGVTTVRLLGCEGNVLRVEGADALDGSPVVDIKYCDTSLFDQRDIHQSIRVDSPRIDIVRHILDGNTRELLLKAAQMHGHVCPGLALGVVGAAKVMQQIYADGEDPQDYTLSMQMKNCPVDGVVFVTGCTAGTNRLEWVHSGNMCFSLKDKQGKGWKVTILDSSREYMNKHIPAPLSPAEKGLSALELPFEQLFSLKRLE